MSDSQSSSENRSFISKYRKIIGIAVAGLALVAIGVAARWMFVCPCETMPGVVLWGEEVEQRIDDWSFANNVELCQIQVRGAVLPQALNLNCMATPDGQLYLSCSFCEPKRWSRLALNNPEARLRLEGRVYPVRLTRVTDPAEADRSWDARLRKLVDFPEVLGAGTPVGTPRPSDEGWWTFRVVSALD